MPYLALLLALSGIAGSLTPGPHTEQILWSPEVFSRAVVVDACHREALRAAHTLLGAPYHFAGMGAGLCPSQEHATCCDCSGLVCLAYAAAGVSLPHSSVRLAAQGEPVAREDMQPGDILIFRSDGSAESQVNHTGIYVGNGLFLHAGSRGVRLDDLDGPYWGDPRHPRLRDIRRIVRMETR